MNPSFLFLNKVREVVDRLDRDAIERAVEVLRLTRERGGRLFCLGSGGGAGHASHAVCDFRKLCGLEAYAPTDNVSELTARINDEGWESSLAGYLEGSRLNKLDCLLVFSVGGGSQDPAISMNLVRAVQLARQVGASVVGVVGRDGGYTARESDACVVVPPVDGDLVTPLTEGFQAVLWHLFVSHPRLQLHPAKWESSLPQTHEPDGQFSFTKIFADGADRKGILEMAANPLIAGFTTNPTLMRKAGVTDYRSFALDILQVVPDKPMSFEVFTDELDEMEEQGREIASWGDNVYVKIPVTNTRGESTVAVVERLSKDGVKVNFTAVMTVEQVRQVLPALTSSPAAYVSIFAGRIADSGRDPLPIMRQALELLRPMPQLQLMWASPRELFNLVQADQIGCHIITVTNDILKKLPCLGKSLEQFSLETVKMFHQDAAASGYRLGRAASEKLA